MFIRFSSEFLLFDKVKHQNHLISAISNLQLVSFKKYKVRFIQIEQTETITSYAFRPESRVKK